MSHWHYLTKRYIYPFAKFDFNEGSDPVDDRQNTDFKTPPLSTPKPGMEASCEERVESSTYSVEVAASPSSDLSGPGGRKGTNETAVFCTHRRHKTTLSAQAPKEKKMSQEFCFGVWHVTRQARY